MTETEMRVLLLEKSTALPPLPNALHLPDGSQFFDSSYGLGSSAVSPAIGPYVASQMTAYALLAVEQERERCARLCDEMAHEAGWSIATAIRKGA